MSQETVEHSDSAERADATRHKIGAHDRRSTRCAEHAIEGNERDNMRCRDFGIDRSSDSFQPCDTLKEEFQIFFLTM